MFKTLYDTTDEEYREFVIKYVHRYHGNELFTAEEKLLLKPTHHFGPRFQTGTIELANPMTDKDGCCGELDKYAELDIARPCVRKDADKIEVKYQLDKYHTGDLDHWRCLGWVNFNFKSAKMANAFRIRCVERLLTDHADLIFSNACPSCGKLRRTPKAKKCMWCLWTQDFIT